MLRRSAGRLGCQLAIAAAGSAEAAAAGSSRGSAATARAAAPALQLFSQWGQQGTGGSSFGAGAAGPFEWSSVRHFSFAPPRQAAGGGGSEGLPSNDTAASASDGAAAAAGSGGGSGLVLTPDAIVEAAAGAEAAALAAAAEDAWAPTRGLQSVLTAAHDAGLDWMPAIALTTVAVRSLTLPLAIMQIKNTYKLSQARARARARACVRAAERAQRPGPGCAAWPAPLAPI